MSLVGDFKASIAKYYERRKAVGEPPRLEFHYQDARDADFVTGVVVVLQDGGILVQGNHGIPEAEIPRLVAWLRSVYDLK